MIEKDWNDCLENNSARKIFRDKAKARSLIETSKNRIRFINSNEKSKNEFLNFIFEEYYSSILEILHALAILDEFRVSNHICIGFYLKKILKKEELFILFDNLRFKRNSIMYYGKTMNLETAKRAIDDSKFLIDELSKMLEKKLQ